MIEPAPGYACIQVDDVILVNAFVSQPSSNMVQLFPATVISVSPDPDNVLNTLPLRQGDRVWANINRVNPLKVAHDKYMVAIKEIIAKSSYKDIDGKPTIDLNAEDVFTDRKFDTSIIAVAKELRAHKKLKEISDPITSAEKKTNKQYGGTKPVEPPFNLVVTCFDEPPAIPPDYSLHTMELEDMNGKKYWIYLIPENYDKVIDILIRNSAKILNEQPPRKNKENREAQV